MIYLYELFDVIQFDLDVINIVVNDYTMTEVLEDKNFFAEKDIPEEWHYYLVKKVFVADDSCLVIKVQQYKCPTCKYDFFDLETHAFPCKGCKENGFNKWAEDEDFNG